MGCHGYSHSNDTGICSGFLYLDVSISDGAIKIDEIDLPLYITCFYDCKTVVLSCSGYVFSMPVTTINGPSVPSLLF